MFDKKITFLLSASLVITAGLYSGYYFYNKEINRSDDKNPSENNISYNVQAAPEKSKITNYTDKADLNKTSKDTKMIYEYRYTQDGITRRKEKTLPPELINKTRSVIENVFDEWSIVTFSNDEIVLRKEIFDSESTDYIIKDYNGIVTVFYNVDNEEKLKEYTKTYISSLPKDEQELLKKGIKIKGNTNLLKILQDYES